MRNTVLGLTMLSALSCHYKEDVGSGGNKVVLIELFTDTGCIPCVESDYWADSIAVEDSASVVLVKVPVNWIYPGDPFYAVAKENSDTRAAYYGITELKDKVAPQIIFDGVNHNVGIAGMEGWEAQVSQRKAEELKVDISVVTASSYYNPSARSGNLVLDVEDQSGAPASVSVRVALTESEIQYDASNGVQVHHYVMRDMFPDANGIVQPLSHNSVSVAFSYDTAWAEENLRLVAFLQDDATREVLDAVEIKVTDLPSSDSLTLLPPLLLETDTFVTMPVDCLVIYVHSALKNQNNIVDTVTVWFDTTGIPASWNFAACAEGGCFPGNSVNVYLDPFEKYHRDSLFMDLFPVAPPDTYSFWLYAVSQYDSGTGTLVDSVYCWGYTY